MIVKLVRCIIRMSCDEEKKNKRWNKTYFDLWSMKFLFEKRFILRLSFNKKIK